MVMLPIPATPMLAVILTVMLMQVPIMDTESGIHTMRLGASLRDRATLPSPLRGLGPSGGYPSRLRSLRSLRAPLARRFAALTAVAGPTRPVLHSTAPCAAPTCPPRPLALRRLRRLRASPRLVAAALRASPVPASPFTGLRTASCTAARTSADTTARACLPVLRTTPCSSRCTSRRSSAAAAPTSRCRRRRFPERRCCTTWPSRPPGRPWVSHLTHR